MNDDVLFNLLLEQRLRKMTKRQIAAFKRRKPGKRQHPIAIEHTYAQQISGVMKKLITKSLDLLKPKLLSWGFHKDSPAEELQGYVDEMNAEIERMMLVGYTSGEVMQLLIETTEKLFKYNKNYWDAQVTLVTGTPLSTSYSWWTDTRKLWEQENHRLIKNLSTEYVTKLNSTLVTAYESGWSFTETVNAIQKLADGISGYRARLIARDQVGKLQYAVTKEQFASVGMDGYIWETARDERVRGNPLGRYPKALPSHWTIDYRVCKFSDPTVFSLDAGETWIPRYADMPLVHPGQAIMCRCVAAPYWVPLIERAQERITGGV